MLDVVRPAQIDSGRSSAKFDKAGVEVELAHADREEWTIWATVGERDAIVGTLGAHEHFFAPTDQEDEDHPWTTEIVDFVAEILRGEVEVETTFRGRSPVSVRHFNLDESGRRQPLGYTGFLTPARFLPWRAKRTEIERVSWL